MRRRIVLAVMMLCVAFLPCVASAITLTVTIPIEIRTTEATLEPTPEPTPEPPPPSIEWHATGVELILCEGGARSTRDISVTFHVRNEAALTTKVTISHACDEATLLAYAALGYPSAPTLETEVVALQPDEECDVRATLAHDPNLLVSTEAFTAYQAAGVAPEMCFSVTWTFTDAP